MENPAALHTTVDLPVRMQVLGLDLTPPGTDPFS